MVTQRLHRFCLAEWFVVKKNCRSWCRAPLSDSLSVCVSSRLHGRKRSCHICRCCARGPVPRTRKAVFHFFVTDCPRLSWSVMINKANRTIFIPRISLTNCWQLTEPCTSEFNTGVALSIPSQSHKPLQSLHPSDKLNDL